MQFNQTANQVIKFINETQHSVFLTGNAGTGKTTLVNYIIKSTFKKQVVVAPTGIAALNAKGVTIHSMFQLPFACFIPDKSHQFYLNTSVKIEDRNTLGRHFKMNAGKKTVIEEMELLVIDEVSMLRPDVLDAIDFMLQKIRKNYLPFGGVQVLFVGDLMQLPPVIGQDEWQILNTYYAGKFFFHAKVFEKQKPIYIELDKIYRQQDATFINILNQLRKNHLDEKYKLILNQKVQLNFDIFHQPGYIALTTHNRKADQINQQAIQNIDAKSYTFKAEIIGDFPEHIYPVDAHLILKEGAQVMFVKNDPNPEKQFFNGKMGVIKTLSANEVLVYFQDEDKTIEVEKYEWEHIKFKLNEDTKEVEEEKIGTFVQYPLKLAWAITVHKSQGLTFEKAVLDVNDVFVSGQMYVAFSRLTSLDGLVLTAPFEVQRFDSHEDVLDYAARKLDFEINDQIFQKEKVNFIRNFVKDGFDWKKNIAFWKNHIYTYQNETDQSYKSRSKGAITALYQSFIELNKHAEKFITELKNIIDQESIDFNRLHSRSQAALNYFLPSLRKIHLDLKVKIIDSQKQKRAKQYYKELLELDYHFLAVVLQLFRVVKFVECLKENQEINKELLISPDFTEYHTKLKEEAINTHRERSTLLVEDTYDDIVLEKKSKPKKEKEQKISTYQQTLTLFRENM